MEIRPLALVMRRNRGSLSAHRGALECHRDKYTNTQIHKDKYTNTNTQAKKKSNVAYICGMMKVHIKVMYLKAD